MSAPIHIRQNRPDDVPRLFAIWRDAVAATHDFVSAEDRAAIAVAVETEYLPTASLLVAVDGDDRPVGFLGGDDNEIDAIFIDPAFHGAGIGTALIDQFLANKQGPFWVEVNEANGDAIRFYEKRGFVTVERIATDRQGRAYPLLRLRRD